MRALDAIFATLKAIVDDIVTCGMAFTVSMHPPTDMSTVRYGTVFLRRVVAVVKYYQSTEKQMMS